MNLAPATRKIRRFFLHNRRLPTYAEMQEIFGYQSKNAVHYLVKKLIEAGLLEKDAKGKLLPKHLFAIPKLGIIRAGVPMAADPLLEENVDFYQFLLGLSSEMFSLTIRGDSMEGVGIREGDIALIAKDKIARDGDVVAAVMENEWTLKTLKKQGTDSWLVPANAKYRPIRCTANTFIGGVMVNLIRSYTSHPYA